MKDETKAGKKPKTAMSNAERQQKFRERQEAARRAEVRGIIAHVDDHPEIKEKAARIVRRRERIAKREASCSSPRDVIGAGRAAAEGRRVRAWLPLHRLGCVALVMEL